MGDADSPPAEHADLARLVHEWERYRSGGRAGPASGTKAYALCISPGVTALLGVAAAEHDAADQRLPSASESRLLLDRGLVDWRFLHRALGSAPPPPAEFDDVAAREAEAAAFRLASRSLAAAARHADAFLAAVDGARFRSLYADGLAALGERAATVELLYAAHRSGQHALAFAGLVALLERLLSDLFVRDQPAAAPPHLLKELLVSDCARAALGPDGVFALRCFVGPPTGLNLRNIVWHGFLSSSELDGTFSSLLFPVFFSVVAAICEGPAGPRPAFARPPVSFAAHAAVLRREGYTPLALPSPARLARLAARSLFVLGGRESDLLAALEDCRAGRTLSGVVRLLPLLEMCLRRIFVAENGLPLGALWAESCALYTTLDDVLGAGVCFGEEGAGRRGGGGGPFAGPRSGGRPNALRAAIGTGLLWALYDAALAYDGPRLRDRVAHGETIEGGIPEEVAGLLWGVAVALCARFEPPDPAAAGAGGEEPALAAIAARFEGHRSAFHPLCVLRRALEDAEAEAGRLASELAAAAAARPPRHSSRLLDDDRAEYYELPPEGAAGAGETEGGAGGTTLEGLAGRAAALCAALEGEAERPEARDCSAAEHGALGWLQKAAEELHALLRLLRDRLAELMPLALARKLRTQQRRNLDVLMGLARAAAGGASGASGGVAPGLARAACLAARRMARPQELEESAAGRAQKVHVAMAKVHAQSRECAWGVAACRARELADLLARNSSGA